MITLQCGRIEQIDIIQEKVFNIFLLPNKKE